MSVIELSLYIALAAMLTLLIALKARADVRRTRRASRAPSHPRQMSKEEAATRELIGDDAYEDMVRRVDDIVSLHSSDRFVSVSLSSGPESPDGWKALRRLLPGDAVGLKFRDVDGLRIIDVLCDDVRIGSVLLTAADRLMSDIGSDAITGAYVAEQNSYGDSNVAAMRIIVFHSAHSDSLSPALRRNDMLHVNTRFGRSFDLCQN